MGNNYFRCSNFVWIRPISSFVESFSNRNMAQLWVVLFPQQLVILYMELFERTALETAPHRPRVWLRYFDDTFVVIKKQYLDEFTNHINSQNEYIKFTCDLAKDGELPFLDTVVKQSDDGTLSVSVYRKPTHTDQYLSFESHHPLEHKPECHKDSYSPCRIRDHWPWGQTERK